MTLILAIEGSGPGRYAAGVEPGSDTTSSRSARFGRLLGPVRAALGFALDVGLPPLCPACRDLVGDDGGLCAACWAKLSFIAPPYCERLGIPFAYDPGPGILSMEAIADPPAYDRARAAVRYDDVAAHAGACASNTATGSTSRRCMGRWMARAGRELLAEADALVPVPLHWRRLWARRFNQSAALAEAISQRKRRRRSLHDALARVQGDAAAGRPVAHRARRQRAGRLPRRRRPARPRSPAGG